jgi:predicted secreted protein
LTKDDDIGIIKHQRKRERKGKTMNKIEELMIAAYNMGYDQNSRDEFEAYCDHMNVDDNLRAKMLEKFEEGYDDG